MKLLTTTFILSSYLCLNAQIQFTDLSLPEAVEKAQAENKNIFIDVYTTWCAPCKMLDRKTFQDKELGEFMNQYFVNLKWDAESDRHRSDAEAFKVQGYPTLLFLDKKSNLVSKQMGFKSAKDLSTFAYNFSEIYLDDQIQNGLQHPNELTQTERKELLEKLVSLDHEKKQELFDMYIQNRIAINETYDDHKILVDNFSLQYKDLFDTIVNGTKVASLYNPSGKQIQFEENQKISKQISKIITKAIQENDLDLLNEAFSMKSVYRKKLANPKSKEDLAREENVHLLAFYEENVNTSKYIEVSHALISNYITKHTVDEFKSKDEKTFETNQKLASLISGDTLQTNSDISYAEKYIFSCNAAKRLTDISSTYFSILSNEDDALDNTLDWYKMTTELHPKPSYFYDYANALLSLGKNDKAKDILKETIHLESISQEEIEKCNTLLKRL